MVTQHKKQQYTTIRQYVTDKISDMMTVTMEDDDDARQQKMDTTYISSKYTLHWVTTVHTALYMVCVSSRKL